MFSSETHDPIEFALMKRAESAEQKLAELVAILGDDPVGRAKMLIQQHERLVRLHNDAGTTAQQLDQELQLADDAAEELGFERGSATPADVIRKLATQCREADERTETVRAALAEKDAALENVRAILNSTQTAHEEAAKLAHSRGLEIERLREQLASIERALPMFGVTLESLLHRFGTEVKP